MGASAAIKLKHGKVSRLPVGRELSAAGGWCGAMQDGSSRA